MIQPKPTLTVAMPAHNEGKNISYMLKSLLRQTQNNIAIKDIKIYTDGCTDNTIKAAQKIQKDYPVIKIIEGKKRRGKMYRLNQIFSDCQSDILVLLDADIKIVGDNFLDNISKGIIEYIFTFVQKKLTASVIHIKPLLTTGLFQLCVSL